MEQRIFCIKWIITTTTTENFTEFKSQNERNTDEEINLYLKYYTYWQKESSQTNIILIFKKTNKNKKINSKIDLF